MDASKDYYAILGVLPSIEQTALKAVYLALLKKYHPDVYKGNISDAERITKQLNEAYSILGDQTRRAEYDALRKTKSSDGGDFSQENTPEGNDNFDAELERDWKYIKEYFPEAEQHRKKLQSISISLSIFFQHIIITEKLSEKSTELANLLKKEYLQRYFGTDVDVQNFALKMLEKNKRNVALEINSVVRIIGTPTKDKMTFIMKTIANKHGEQYNPEHKDKYNFNINNKKYKTNEKKCPYCNRITSHVVDNCTDCDSLNPG